jgi:putative Holliday junction resolvase
VAISDPTNTIASPLTVIKHSSRPVDAAVIAGVAKENEAGLIVLGQSMDDEGHPTPSSRRAAKLADAIRLQCDIPVEFWDESFSTHLARQAKIEMNTPIHKRRGHLDEMAAVVILQSYLDRSIA